MKYTPKNHDYAAHCYLKNCKCPQFLAVDGAKLRIKLQKLQVLTNYLTKLQACNRRNYEILAAKTGVYCRSHEVSTIADHDNCHKFTMNESQTLHYQPLNHLMAASGDAIILAAKILPLT